MSKLHIDTEVSTERLEGMDLAFESDKKYIHSGRGIQRLVVTDRGEIVAYLCLFPLTEHGYACYLIPTVLIKKYSLKAARLIKKEFEYQLSQLDWRLVQTVSKNDKMINRWMKFLKFKKTEKVKVSDDKNEFYVWGRSVDGR